MIKKVTVRIAVVVDQNGKWSACGFDTDGDDLIALAVEMLPEVGSAWAEYWVTAELEVPAAKTVAGNVAEQQR